MLVLTEGTLTVGPDGGITAERFDFDAEGGETTMEDAIASRIVLAARRMEASRADRVEAITLKHCTVINEAE